MISYSEEQSESKLFWETHLEYIDVSDKNLCSLDGELDKWKLILKVLEKQIVVVQERYHYLFNENTVRDEIMFKNYKDILEQEINNLKVILGSIKLRARELSFKQDLKSFIFIKIASEKWKEGILKILRIIYDILLKPLAEYLIQIIINETEEEEKYEGENLMNTAGWVPNKIYEKKCKLFSIPFQSSKRIDELQQKI